MEIEQKQRIKSWALHISVALFIIIWPYIFFRFVSAGQNIIYKNIEPESKWGQYAIKYKLMKPKSEWVSHHANEAGPKNSVVVPKGQKSVALGKVWIEGKEYQRSADNIYIINGKKVFYADDKNNDQTIEK